MLFFFWALAVLIGIVVTIKSKCQLFKFHGLRKRTKNAWKRRQGMSGQHGWGFPGEVVFLPKRRV